MRITVIYFRRYTVCPSERYEEETNFVAFFLVSLLSVSIVEEGKGLAGTALGTISSKGFHNT